MTDTAPLSFTMSTAGLAYDSQTGKPLSSYGELWENAFVSAF
jgi:hypothetical protein